jgi:hypothetical protein
MKTVLAESIPYYDQYGVAFDDDNERRAGGS